MPTNPTTIPAEKLPVLVAVPNRPEAEDATRGADRALTLLSDYMHTEVREIGTDELAQQVNKFVGTFQKIVGSIETEIGRYHLESVEVSAEVGAEGGLTLLGSGVKVSGKGGMTFVFKRV